MGVEKSAEAIVGSPTGSEGPNLSIRLRMPVNSPMVMGMNLVLCIGHKPQKRELRYSKPYARVSLGKRENSV